MSRARLQLTQESVHVNGLTLAYLHGGNEQDQWRLRVAQPADLLHAESGDRQSDSVVRLRVFASEVRRDPRKLGASLIRLHTTGEPTEDAK